MHRCPIGPRHPLGQAFLVLAVLHLGAGPARGTGPLLDLDTALVEPGETVQATVLGEPGQHYALAVSAGIGGFTVGGTALRLGPDVEVVATGRLGADGRASVALAPVFDPGVGKLYLQAVTASTPAFEESRSTPTRVLRPVPTSPTTVATVPETAPRDGSRGAAAGASAASAGIVGVTVVGPSGVGREARAAASDGCPECPGPGTRHGTGPTGRTPIQVGGGRGNAAPGLLAWVGGGLDNTARGDYSVVGGGAQNQAEGPRTTISGGAEGRALGDLSTIGGGAANQAAGIASTVAGGAKNEALGQSSTVGGGQENAATGGWATVAGGLGNIASGLRAVATGGELNTASGAFGAVGGGFGNRATGAGVSTVAGGHLNLAGGIGTTVGGGTENHAEGAGATVSGGVKNVAPGSFATVPGGLEARAALWGQVAHAAGSFVQPGDAQTSTLVLRRVTTDGTLDVPLLLDGSTKHLTLESGQVLAFDGLVVAGEIGGQLAVAAYAVRGVVRRLVSGVSVVGTPEVVTLGEDNPAWNVTVASSTPDLALLIRVTGAPGQTVRWVAALRTAEVVR